DCLLPSTREDVALFCKTLDIRKRLALRAPRTRGASLGDRRSAMRAVAVLTPAAASFASARSTGWWTACNERSARISALSVSPCSRPADAHSADRRFDT